MRVITGKARGIRLEIPEGMDIRPTVDRVKEGLFSAIQFEVEGRKVLDLFSGSGQLGIEALSRGAESADFVDINSKAIAITKKNLEKTELLENSEVHAIGAEQFVARTEKKFDLIFLDPPYDGGIILEILEKAHHILSHKGTVVCEVKADKNMPTEFEGLNFKKEYKYGKTKIVVYKKES